MTAGGLAGLSIALCLHPVDSIKTRLQASSSKVNYSKKADSVSIYKGLAAQMAAAFPCAAAFWIAYEFSKYFIATNIYLNTYLNIHVQHILASACAEVCQALIRCPFEVVKQNLQIGKYKTTMEAIDHINKTKGFMGFYAGFGPFVARDIPFSAIQLPLYEVLKMTAIGILAASAGVDARSYQLPGFVNSINGSIAGATSGFLTTPLDVLKTRQMTFQSTDSQGKNKKVSITTDIANIVDTDGVPGLFKGALMRMMYLTLGGFAFFGVYEYTKELMSTIL